MSWLQPKLHLKVSQRQILTPGLVQMVSVLALNRLELREMLNQELVANPVLEELTEEGPVSEDYSTETFLKAETEKLPDTEAPNPFDEFDVSALYQYLDSGSNESDNRERETIERPSFEKFLSSPTGLTEHLEWQLHGIVCTEKVREIAETIIGNLDEDGYLTASLDEVALNGGYSMDDVEEALAVVQEFDPLGVGARNLRECLLIQLHVLDPQNTLAHQLVSECLPKKTLAAGSSAPVDPSSAFGTAVCEIHEVAARCAGEDASELPRRIRRRSAPRAWKRWRTSRLPRILRPMVISQRPLRSRPRRSLSRIHRSGSFCRATSSRKSRARSIVLMNSSSARWM